MVISCRNLMRTKLVVARPLQTKVWKVSTLKNTSRETPKKKKIAGVLYLTYFDFDGERFTR